jgi:glycosyl transferase family 2
VRVVGSVLVRNEDVFLERAIRNVATVCDRIHAVDHLSSDRTWELLRELAATYDHLDIRRAPKAGVSHEVLEPYVGTETWALRVDGDEIYDPRGLERMRLKLEAGAYGDRFRIQGSVLHSDALDDERRTASGYLSPPSRPITSLFNLGALDSWRGCPERLHGGKMAFRQAYAWDVVEPLHEELSWDESPLRCLHVCFLRRSSLESNGGGVRLSLAETGMYRRGVGGWLRRAVRRDHVDEQQLALQARGSSWKLEKYRRGPVVEKDVTAFFAP